MAENKIIKHEGGSVVKHVSKAISATNKILSLGDRLKIIELFYRHPQFFIDLISTHYALDESQLERYKSNLNWRKISQNKAIQFTDQILEKYKTILNWDRITPSVIWNENLIKKYSNFLNWNTLLFNKGAFLSEKFIESNLNRFSWVSLSSSESIPWSESFIEKHKDSWLWALLSQNSGLPWSEQLINKYSDKWIWGFTREEMMAAYNENKEIKNTPPFYVKRYLMFGPFYVNRNIPWTEALMNKYKDENCMWSWSINNNLEWSSSFIKKYENEWDWEYLSANHSIPWSISLIELFIEKWDWEQLSLNTSLPWSEELLEKFKDKIKWFFLIGNTSVPWTPYLLEKYYFFYARGKEEHFISKLAQIKLSFWNDNLIDTYLDGLYWPALSKNPTLPWSLTLIQKYEDNWKWDDMGTHEHWEKIFSSFVNDSMIDEVMSKIAK